MGKNPGLILNLLLIGGLAFGGYKLYKFIAGDEAETKKERDEKDEAALNFQITTSKLTLSEADLRIITNLIFQAMNKYGTDEDTILSNLQKLGREDLLFVMKEFGYRLYNGAAESTTWADINLFSQKLDLIGWLKEELGGSDLEKAQAMFQKHQIPF